MNVSQRLLAVRLGRRESSRQSLALEEPVRMNPAAIDPQKVGAERWKGS